MVLGSIRSASKSWREEEDVPVRVIVNLPAPAVEALEGLAAERETTQTEILRHATSLVNDSTMRSTEERGS